MISYVNNGINSNLLTSDSLNPVCNIDIKDNINNNLLRNYYNIHVIENIFVACFFIKFSIFISVCIILYVMLVIKLILIFDKK